MRFALALVALSLVACAETGGSTSRSFSSPSSRSSSGGRAIESFPPQTVAFMKKGLHQFSAGDPGWESTRAQWLAMGPDEADFLVRAMWAALLRFQAINKPVQVEKARHELALIGEPAAPLMAEFVAGGAIYSTVDQESGERKDVVVDDFARGEAAQVLGLIGGPAVPAVREALERVPSKSGQRHALQALGYIGERGGDAAAQPLLRYARSDDDVLRVVAVESLQYFKDETTRSALIQALGDGESLVRRKAAEGLRARKDRTAVAYIRAAAERARADSKLAEAAELDRAASAIEQAR